MLGPSLRYMISLALDSWLGFQYHNDIPLLGMPYNQLAALGHLQDISATTAPSGISPCWLLLWLMGITVGKTDSLPLSRLHSTFSYWEGLSQGGSFWVIAGPEHIFINRLKKAETMFSFYSRVLLSWAGSQKRIRSNYVA